MSTEDPADSRSIPQGLADAMALAATKCWLAYQDGRPWLGDPAVSSRLTDEDAKRWVKCFQHGYLKEVQRRQRACLRQSQAISFPSMPIEYQRALASRWMAWRDEVLAENPGLRWNSKLGFHWIMAERALPIRSTSLPVMWRGKDIRINEIVDDLLAEGPL